MKYELLKTVEERVNALEKEIIEYKKSLREQCKICCKGCDLQYYVGRKYHQQLMRVFWRISTYLLTKLSIPDIHFLEDEIVKLEQIYEQEYEEEEDG